MVEKQSQQPAWKQKIDNFERLGPLERLGLQKGATKAEAKAARNEILKRFHPDLGIPDTPFNRAVVRLVNEAYEYLSGKAPVDSRPPRDQGSRYTWEKHRTRPPSGVHTTNTWDPFGFGRFERDDPRNSDDWFEEMMKRTHDVDKENRESEKYREDLYEDIFGKRSVPNEPKDIKQKAVEEAHKGPASFDVLMRDLKRSHSVADADALLRDTNVTRAILSEALKLRSKHNRMRWHMYYGLLMEDWARIGFDRNKIDSDERLVSRIYADLIDRAGDVYFPVHFLEEGLVQWERNNPAFRRSEFLASPELKRVVQKLIDDAKALDKKGETSILKADNIFWLDRLVQSWKERAHIDILSLGV